MALDADGIVRMENSPEAKAEEAISVRKMPLMTSQKLQTFLDKDTKIPKGLREGAPHEEFWPNRKNRLS